MVENNKNLHSKDSFGARFRKLRKEKNLSQSSMAEILGYKRSGSISKIEKSGTPLDISTLIKISETLETDLHLLITGKDSPSVMFLKERLKSYGIILLDRLSCEIIDFKKREFDLKLLKNKDESSIRELYWTQEELSKLLDLYQKISFEMNEIFNYPSCQIQS